jgi:4-hydroxybutyryl-CoA dehydratase/vinylacetyl-CoA-Delta-isomerase
MPMMTAGQYEESLKRLNLVVYMFGKKLDNVVDDPIIRPSMQAEQDFKSPESGKWLEKYYTAHCDAPTVNRMRILRLIENMTLGTAAVGYLKESMHGAGSPQAQRIMISRRVNIEEKKRAAKKLCGIEEE